MGVTTRQQCTKLGGPGCGEERKIVQQAPRLCSAYNLRPRKHPAPNYYETHVRRRNWKAKRKPRAKTGLKTERCPVTSNEKNGDLEAARRCCPEPMNVEEEGDDAGYPMRDASCEDLDNHRLVEAVENKCTAFGTVHNDGDVSPDGCSSSAAEIDSDFYRRRFPEYAPELSAGYHDYNIIDLTQSSQGSSSISSLVEPNNNLGLEGDWRNEVDECCDSDSTLYDAQVPDVHNVGHTNEPEEHL